jgi:uncharacterized protein (TIGR00730 family)
MTDYEARLPKTSDEELLEAETPDVLSLESDEARLRAIRRELDMGFKALAHVGKAVSIFGSARTTPDDPSYQLAREVSRRLGQRGFAIITGGGPGIMAAGNQGAHDAGGPSIGLDIELPHEENVNPWVDLQLRFHYFFTRKVMFVRYASAFVVFPGGLGTLDELFEALTLIQTEKIHDFPVILVGTDYWSGLRRWLEDTALAAGNIDPEDLERMRCTDDPDEVVRIVEEADHRRPRKPEAA